MAADDAESRLLPPYPDDDDDRANRIIAATRSFRQAVVDEAEGDTDDDDDGQRVTALTDRALRVAGLTQRRADETRDAHAVRVFARLLDACARDGTPDPDAAADRRRRDWALYAGEAAESGRAEKAARWLCRLIADRPSDAAAWLLYAAFCARRRPSDMPSALACARRAVALDDGRHRLAPFALAAILMTADDGCGCGDDDGDDELESTLRRMLSAHPLFAEAQFLAAVHSRRAGMPADRTDRLLSLAARHATAAARDAWPPPTTDAGHDDAEQLLAAFSAAWPPIRHRGDAAVGCAALLVALGLDDLAAVCARTFSADPHSRPSYHYLMAVVHHRRGEFDASADHLAAADDDAEDDRLSVLAANNDYGAGRTQEAMARYAALLSSRPSGAHYGLAYSRLARYTAARGEHAEAADAYYGACAATRTPALMTALATSLMAAAERDGPATVQDGPATVQDGPATVHDGPAMVHDGPAATAVVAERLLCEAVALDGDCDGDAWHSLAVLHATCGRAEMADACGRQAVVLGFGPWARWTTSDPPGPALRLCSTTDAVLLRPGR